MARIWREFGANLARIEEEKAIEWFDGMKRKKARTMCGTLWRWLKFFQRGVTW